MTQRAINPEAQRLSKLVADSPLDEVWANDVYDCQVRYLEARGRGGALHLSIKRLDREPAHDWRHFQAIKNEIAGWEREAVELYPAESRLVDGSNQYHLWVLGAGEQLPVGFDERGVGDFDQMVAALAQYNVKPGKARQRPWQPGISTGPNYRPGGSQ